MILIAGVWHLPSVDMVTEFDSAFEVIGAAVAVLAASGADSEPLVDTIEEVSVAVAVVEMILGSEIIYCHIYCLCQLVVYRNIL